VVLYWFTSDVLEYIPAPIVHEKNTIGAGDSMLAGMLLKAQAGHTPKIMIQYGSPLERLATLRQGSPALSNRRCGEDI